MLLWWSTAHAAPGSAVVELFTSESCSSCPPADALASEVAAKARADRAPVWVVAWHVDYWNALQWVDPFSTPEATARQRAYARALHLDVYTPQIVVDGSVGFVGSDRNALDRALDDARARPDPATVSISAPEPPTDRLAVDVHVEGAPAGSTLVAAVLESGLAVDVKRGENAGRRLVHDGVVRSFVERPAADGRVWVPWPSEVDRSRASVVVWVRGPDGSRILGAAGADLR